jgi:hypothetical protein
LKRILLVIALLFVIPCTLKAQGLPPCKPDYDPVFDPPCDTGVPIDEEVLVLVIIAGFYGAYRVYKAKRNPVVLESIKS